MPLQVLHSAMTGAPTISGQSGVLTTMLKACLVDGFGLVTLDSVVVSGGIATATRAAGHAAVVGGYQTIAGATPSGLNGDKLVLSVTTNTFTFDATGISNQTATGTITSKVSPLGWTREYNATNIEVFRSPNTAGARHYLRVDDGGAEPREARVVGYETMSDVNTGTGPMPTSAQVSGGGYWPKSNAASSSVRSWVLIGDDRTFYLMVAHSAGSSYSVLGFGDFESYKAADAYAAFLGCYDATGVAVTAGASQYELDYTFPSASTSDGLYVSRAYTGLGSSSPCKRVWPIADRTANALRRSGQVTNLWQYPNGPDGGLYVGRPLLTEAASTAIRGRFRGFYITPQLIGTAVFAHLEPVVGVTGLSGRTLRAAHSASGPYFFDQTGPW